MNNNLNKTFADLKKGDKIYVVETDLPKLKVVTLKICHIDKEKNCKRFYTKIDSPEYITANGIKRIYPEHLDKEKCMPTYRYEYLHTSMEAARNTIKEAIQYRIKKHERTIKESKRAIENYKRELEKYEDL